jgi:hypothetical protein
MLGRGVRTLLRAAADLLTDLADQSAGETAAAFAGVDLVGIDFSTSIQPLASHVIRGWDRYRCQMETLRPDHGIWLYGINAIPFRLTAGPVPPGRLPQLRMEHFQRWGHGRGLIEYGSAFYDYFRMALRQAERWTIAHGGSWPSVPITISLLCDGAPNGGTYRAGDVSPLLAEARARGVRFKVAGFVLRQYQAAMWQFRESLGLTGEELEVAWYDEGTPSEQEIRTGFELLLDV